MVIEVCLQEILFQSFYFKVVCLILVFLNTFVFVIECNSRFREILNNKL